MTDGTTSSTGNPTGQRGTPREDGTAGEHHPFWGTPPDLATGEQWLTTVLIRKQDVERDLSVARAGGAIRDDGGYPVPAEHYPRWLEEKLLKHAKIMRRHLWLKQWQRDEKRRLGIAKGPRKELPSVDAMHAAARRFGLLETLHVALRQWIDSDTEADADEEADAAWQAMLDALEAVEGQGAQTAVGIAA